MINRRTQESKLAFFVAWDIFKYILIKLKLTRTNTSIFASLNPATPSSFFFIYSLIDYGGLQQTEKRGRRLSIKCALEQIQVTVE